MISVSTVGLPIIAHSNQFQNKTALKTIPSRTPPVAQYDSAGQTTLNGQAGQV